MLAVLDEELRSGPRAKQQALWSMRKGERQVECVVVYVVTGFDLRLLEAGEMLRTELFQDALMLEGRSRQWRQALTTTGWR